MKWVHTCFYSCHDLGLSGKELRKAITESTRFQRSLWPLDTTVWLWNLVSARYIKCKSSTILAFPTNQYAAATCSRLPLFWWKHVCARLAMSLVVAKESSRFKRASYYFHIKLASHGENRFDWNETKTLRQHQTGLQHRNDNAERQDHKCYPAS